VSDINNTGRVLIRGAYFIGWDCQFHVLCCAYQVFVFIISWWCDMIVYSISHTMFTPHIILIVLLEPFFNSKLSKSFIWKIKPRFQIPRPKCVCKVGPGEILICVLCVNGSHRQINQYYKYTNIELSWILPSN
jgi:hypothetical protein